MSKNQKMPPRVKVALRVLELTGIGQHVPIEHVTPDGEIIETTCILNPSEKAVQQVATRTVAEYLCQEHSPNQT